MLRKNSIHLPFFIKSSNHFHPHFHTEKHFNLNENKLIFKKIINPDATNLLFKAFKANKPYFFSQNNWRFHVQKSTAQTILNLEKCDELYNQAANNLAKWQKTKSSSQNIVEVVDEDWGHAAQKMSKRYGVICAALNMSSQTFVGGGFLSGLSAQEENMWARTSCGHYIFEELIKGDDSGIYFDETTRAFQYKTPMSNLLSSQTKMTEEELKTLSQRRGKEMTSAYKTYLDTNRPRVCFRDVEVQVSQDDAPLGETYEMDPIKSDSSASFLPLHPEDVFMFYELRSAAVPLPHKDLAVNFNGNQTLLNDYRTQMKQRIDAQLDTCILHGIQHVVLGAFGCGAFKNDPLEVAKIYKESIAERKEHFKHIVFAIYSPKLENNNFAIFKDYLHNFPLLGTSKIPEPHHLVENSVEVDDRLILFLIHDGECFDGRLIAFICGTFDPEVAHIGILCNAITIIIHIANGILCFSIAITC